MKAKIAPLRFAETDPVLYDKIITALKNIYASEIDFYPEINLGDSVSDIDAVLIPVITADLYKEIDTIIDTLSLPLVVITTEFGVSLMFDWEGVNYLKSKGLDVYNPYNVDMGKTLFKALALKRNIRGQKFLIFQDSPGDGLLPEIFKVFYWWNEECTNEIKKKFGISIIIKPYKDLCEKAKAISDDAVHQELKRWDFATEFSNQKPLIASTKFFMAVRDEVDREGNVVGCGVNCLNEAYDSDTTPCLAWNLLYQDRDIMWVCEGDTSTLMTQYIMGATIDTAVFATNIYPFLSGMPALSHEKIQSFPDVVDPDHHALLAHCGYFGCMAQKHTTKWVLRPPVLDWLVGENSVAIDAEIQKGDIVLCKLNSTFDSVLLEKSILKDFVQYPGSDCRNGGLIRLSDGYKFMEKNYSHHVVVLSGAKAAQLKITAKIFNIKVDEV